MRSGQATAPFAAGAFTSRLHNPRIAARLGLPLGTSFLVCFATGLISHFAQNPLDLGFLSMPASSDWLYRVTQGIHVAAGMAAIPLLLAKLWTVYPKLFGWPPLRDAAHAVERVTLLVLVAGALPQLFSGLANTTRWYPWQFSFTVTHYWTAWIVIGALGAHVGAKLTISRTAVEAALGGTGAARRRTRPTRVPRRRRDDHDHRANGASALPLEDAMRAASGLPGRPDAPGVGGVRCLLGRCAAGGHRAGRGVSGRGAGLALVPAEPPAPAGTGGWRRIVFARRGSQSGEEVGDTQRWREARSARRVAPVGIRGFVLCCLCARRRPAPRRRPVPLRRRTVRP